MTLASANRRTSRSLAVKPPSRNIGMREQVRRRRGDDEPGLVQCLAERRDPLVALGSVASKANTSLSWKFTPYAPSSASLRTARSAGIGGRTAGPNTSTPCQPTVQMPNEKWSARDGM